MWFLNLAYLPWTFLVFEFPEGTSEIVLSFCTRGATAADSVCSDIDAVIRHIITLRQI